MKTEYTIDQFFADAELSHLYNDPRLQKLIEQGKAFNTKHTKLELRWAIPRGTLEDRVNRLKQNARYMRAEFIFEESRKRKFKKIAEMHESQLEEMTARQVKAVKKVIDDYILLNQTTPEQVLKAAYMLAHAFLLTGHPRYATAVLSLFSDTSRRFTEVPQKSPIIKFLLDSHASLLMQAYVSENRAKMLIKFDDTTEAKAHRSSFTDISEAIRKAALKNRRQALVLSLVVSHYQIAHCRSGDLGVTPIGRSMGHIADREWFRNQLLHIVNDTYNYIRANKFEKWLSVMKVVRLRKIKKELGLA